LSKRKLFAILSGKRTLKKTQKNKAREAHMDQLDQFIKEIIDTYYRNFYGSYYRVKTKDSGMYYVDKSAVTLL
jgi:hypothetical protein